MSGSAECRNQPPRGTRAQRQLLIEPATRSPERARKTRASLLTMTYMDAGHTSNKTFIRMISGRRRGIDEAFACFSPDNLVGDISDIHRLHSLWLIVSSGWQLLIGPLPGKPARIATNALSRSFPDIRGSISGGCEFLFAVLGHPSRHPTGAHTESARVHLLGESSFPVCGDTSPSGE
jgi:hypothetical protein